MLAKAKRPGDSTDKDPTDTSKPICGRITPAGSLAKEEDGRVPHKTSATNEE